MEFLSEVRGSADEVEFILDAKVGLNHVQSALRLKTSGLGVDRRSVEYDRAIPAAVAGPGSGAPRG